MIIPVGVVAALTLPMVSLGSVAAAPDASVYHAPGVLLRAVYTWAFLLGPLFLLGINTLMCSAALALPEAPPRPPRRPLKETMISTAASPTPQFTRHGSVLPRLALTPQPEPTPGPISR